MDADRADGWMDVMRWMNECGATKHCAQTHTQIFLSLFLSNISRKGSQSAKRNEEESLTICRIITLSHLLLLLLLLLLQQQQGRDDTLEIALHPIRTAAAVKPLVCCRRCRGGGGHTAFPTPPQ
jgi:hypothetical protein